MSPRKEVNALSSTSLRSIRNFVIAICNNLLENEVAPSEYTGLINRIRSQLYDSTARYLHDSIADHCLRALNKWYESNVRDYSNLVNAEELSAKCEVVVRHLVAIVPNKWLKKIHKKYLSVPIASALLQFLNEMPNLEVLNCNHFYEAVNHSVDSLEENILNSCQSLSNLTVFLAWNGCNDRIIDAICVNCKAIQEIGAGSNKVTDLCIESLVTCQKLQKVHLGSSAVSNQGFFKLVTEARSQQLKYFTGCPDMNVLLDLLEENRIPPRHYHLESLIYPDIRDNEHLQMACKHFPLFKELISTSGHVCPDLSCLNEVASLRKLMIYYDTSVTVNLSRFVAVRGEFITSLSFSWHLESHINSILNICVACPNLEKLDVSRGDDLSALWYDTETEDNENPGVVVLAGTFRRLKKFKFHGYMNPHFPKFILRRAVNIEHLEIWPFSNVTDEFFEYVFRYNPLSQLKKLGIFYEINRVSARMLKLLIDRCENLSHVENFWSPSTTLNNNEVESVKNFIVSNNYDLVVW